MDPFVGEVRALAFPYAPAGWAFCNGQTMPIRQSTTLFSLLGTQFGGDGVNTFALPNLMGNLAVGSGQSPGGSNWQTGQFGGSTLVTLDPTQLPSHNHNIVASNNAATSQSTVGNQIATAAVDIGGGDTVDALIYTNGAPNTQLAQQTLSVAGSNQGHSNAMPSLAISYCMAMTGVYPYFG